MKKFSKHITLHGLVIALTILLGQSLYAQSWQINQIWPEEPQAAKLRKVTMAPPALSTGAVTFQVPLYDIKVEDLVLPLELRYHSNGIQVTEDPYPVGFGWSLLPAFRITRQILGRADGRGYEFVGNKPASDFTHAELQRCMVAHSLLYHPGLDPEKDLFTVHMPEGTFTGIYENGEILLPGHMAYKIMCSEKLDSITVTDPKGRIWTFSEQGALYRGADTLEWCLKTIQLPSGKVIEITWAMGVHNPPGLGTYHPYTLYYPDYMAGYTPYCQNPYAGTNIWVEPDPTGVSLNPISISFPGGTVEFVYNETKDPSTLKELIVTSSTTRYVVEKITFARGTSPEEKRMLYSVTYRDGSQYKFTYDPGRITGTGNCDYWGYYNQGGSPYPPSMNIILPNSPNNGRIEGRNRKPDATHMQACLLTSVTYPTGAVCTWEYEPHRFEAVPFFDGPTYWTPDQQLEWGGGLRVIKQTLQKNASDREPYVVEYVYGDDGDGLAKVESYPTASTFLSECRHVSGTIIYYNSEIAEHISSNRIIWEGPIFYGSITASPWSRWMDYRFGEQPIWYTTVEERHPQGKIVHVFDKAVHNDVRAAVKEGTYPREIQTAFGAGVYETLRTEYETTEQGYKPIRETEWSYRMVNGGYPIFNGVRVRRKVSQSATDEAPDFPESKTLDLGGFLEGYPSFYTYEEQDIYEPQSYTMYPYVMELYSVSETEFTPNGPIVRDRTYDYHDSTGIITQETLYDGENRLINEYLYPFNTPSPVSTAMLAANQQGVMIGERVKYGSAVTERKMEYARIGQGNLFRPTKETAARGTATPYTVATYEWNTDGTLKTRTGADGVKVSYTWDTEGLYPLSMTTGSTLTKKLTWEPLVGVKSMTDETGLVTAFTYDSGRRLSEIKKGGRLLQRYVYSINQSGVNSVTANTFTSSYTSHKQISRIDGLGREWATFTETPDGGIVTLSEYDIMGRLSKSWFPAPGTASMTDAQLRQAATGFYSDTAPWRQTDYRPSPTEDIISEMRGGALWLSGNHKSIREVNANGIPNHSHLQNTVTADGVKIAGMAPAGQLRWETVTDEDGVKTTKLTDLRALTLYESKGGGPGATYVYDDYGDLRYILPSGCTREGKRTDSRLPAEAYWYDYDERGRMILSHVPGTRDARYIYDPGDRLVAEQTANHPDGIWRIYAYDNCGRKVLEADCAITDQQARAYGSVVRQASHIFGGNWSGYSLSPEPNFTPEEWEYNGVWYYDSYTFVNYYWLGDDFQPKTPDALGISSRLPAAISSPNPISASLGRLLGFRDYRGWEVYYYDAMGQLCQTCSSGYNRGRKVMTYNYDLSPASVHELFGGEFPDKDMYTAYDKTGRPIETRVIQRRKVGNVEKCDTAFMTTVYDKAGRVSKSGFGTNSTTHTYDVHGWLTSTNTKDAVGRPLFSQKLMYADGKTPLYNGRISSKSWEQGGTPHRYDYTYGLFGFLTKAAYTGGASTWDYTTSYTYDIRGNITSLKRNGIIDMQPHGIGVYGKLDDITASYSSYKLTSLSVESNAETFAARTGMRAEGTFGMEYDFAGRLIYDESRDIRSISYDYDGRKSSMEVGDNGTYTYLYDDSGNLLTSTIMVRSDNGRSRIVKYREYTGNGHIIVDDSLKMTRFPGGYFTPDGGVYYYINDYQGNICKIVDNTGRAYQSMDYYPYGEPFQEWNWDLAESSSTMSSSRYLYSGNERETGLGVNQYDFLARDYVASFPRFNAIDPMAASSAAYSPYLYSNGDPVNNIDPNGRSTQVKQTGANTYEVIGGELDGDLNVYLYTPDENGNYTVQGESIGTTTTETAFYNSDSKSWRTGAIIDLSDPSGQIFLSKLFSSTPYLLPYILTAGNGAPLDFKAQNQNNYILDENNNPDQEKKTKYYYRGMLIYLNEDGSAQIASARDIGNIAAGYVAAVNGLPYPLARLGFDAYQGSKEGISSTQAQQLGYDLGLHNSSSIERQLRLVSPLHHLMLNALSKLFK